MKNLYILILSLFSFSISAQKIKAIGVDLGGNILPLLTKYQGFTGGVVIRSLDKLDKQREYIIGYASLQRPNNRMSAGGGLDGRFTQQSEGFYGSIGQNFSKNWGWHGTLSVYNLTTTLFLKDNDFDVPYQYELPKESLVSAGGDIFLNIPAKITENLSSDIRLSVSFSIGLGTKNSEQVLYAPGFNQLTPKIWVPTFGFGISIPFMLNLIPNSN